VGRTGIRRAFGLLILSVQRLFTVVLLKKGENRVELSYNVIKGTVHCVVITEECNVMINSEGLIGTAGYLTL